MDPRPPRLIERILLRCLPAGVHGQSMAGDLRESYTARIAGGRFRANAWFTWEAVRLICRYAPASIMALMFRRRRVSMWNEFRQDLRYGVRALLRRPGFALVAILTLALGIGANTAIFTVVNGVLLRPLPYENPDDLVMIWNRVASGSMTRVPVSGPDFADYATETTSFSAFAAANGGPATLVEESGAEEVIAGFATANLFRFLGVSPVLGRNFRDEDGAPLPQDVDPVPPTVALISHEFWQARFGGDPGVIGHAVTLNGRRTIIEGVLPPRFSLLLPADAGVAPDIDIWTPMQFNFAQGSRRSVFLRVLARLRPGVTLEQAKAEMDALGARFRELYQPHRVAGVYIEVAPLSQQLVTAVRPTLLALLTAVALLLLVACANVASLLLAQATTRRQEMAVRLSLGAGRFRLVRQLLTESAVLAGAAAALGLAIGTVAVRLLLRAAPTTLPRTAEIGVNGTVVLFTVLIAGLAALLFGTAPALPRSLPAVGDALRGRGVTGQGKPGKSPLRSALVVTQVALSLALLFGTGLILRTFMHISAIRPGFDAADRASFRIQLPFLDYPTPEAQQTFFTALRDRLRAIPGVSEASAIRTIPFQASPAAIWQSYRIDDEPEDNAAGYEATIQPVLAGALEAMGVRLREGRFLTDDDFREGRRVVVIDEGFARRWGTTSPIGRVVRLRLPGNQGVQDQTPMVPLEVVGVVESMQIEQLGRMPRDAMYLPLPLYPVNQMGFVAHAPGVPLTRVQAEIQQMVRELNSGIPVTLLRPLADYLDDARAPLSFTLTLAMAFGGLALTIATVGLFGVISFLVRMRTREIGVRMALGASRRRILTDVLRTGLLLAATGTAIGLVASFWLSRGLQSMLIGVPHRDPVTAVFTVLLVLSVALLACLMPAGRAARLQPSNVLKLD